MAAFPQVRSDPDDVASRLAELGLTVGILHEAIAQGEVARSNCTENHPPMTAGQTAWSETVRALRDQLLAEGWSKDDAGNYSRTIHPGGAFAVVVATGNEHTGSLTMIPNTKSAKGPKTRDAVQVNALYLDLFAGSEWQPAHASDVERTESGVAEATWILLVHRHRDAIRAELSMPLTMGLDNRVETWRERIVLPDLDLGDGLAQRPAPEPGPDFEIDVSRRAG